MDHGFTAWLWKQTSAGWRRTSAEEGRRPPEGWASVKEYVIFCLETNRRLATSWNVVGGAVVPAFLPPALAERPQSRPTSPTALTSPFPVPSARGWVEQQ
jgi:hypothetical protein